MKLTPADPPSGWHGALEGARGGLRLTLFFRAKRGGGEIGGTWHYEGDKSPIRDQAAALAIVDCMRGAGTLVIEDVEGSPRKFEQVLTVQPADDFVESARRLMDDLVVIEDWTGRTLQIPDELSGEELRTISEVAYVIRSGQSHMEVAEVLLAVPPEKRESVPLGLAEVGLETGYGFEFGGEEIFVGYLSGSYQARIDKISGEDGEILTRAVPATSESSHPIFTLSREKRGGEPAEPD